MVAKPLPATPGYVDEEPLPRHSTLVCPECESMADEEGYCSEPGCRNMGKTVQVGRLDNFWAGGASK